MALKNVFLTFEVHLNDAAQVAALQAHPPGVTIPTGNLWIGDSMRAINRALFTPGPPIGGAAVEFGTTAEPVLQLIGPNDHVPQNKPYIFSEHLTSTNNYPSGVASFTRKSGGWFGISLLFGTTTRYWWTGVFVYDPPATASSPTGPGTRSPIPIRRWLEPFYLFEDFTQGVSADGALQDGMTRDASRTPDGCGFAMRGQSTTVTRALTQYTGGGVSTENQSWERLYIRLRKPGSTVVQFWRSHATVSNASGIALQIAISGQIVVYNINQSGGATLLGSTTALVVGRWYRLDILLTYNAAASGGAGSISLYLNGAAVLSVGVADALGGLGQNSVKHSTTELGAGVLGYTTEIDIGFWMNARQPTASGSGVGAVQLDSIDWLNGSRAVLVRPRGFATATGWVGDWRLLLQKPLRGNSEGVESATDSALLEVTTDVDHSVLGHPGGLGAASMIVHRAGFKGGTGVGSDGTLGYRIGAGAPVDATVVEHQTIPSWNTVFYPGPATALPADLTGLQLRYVHGVGGFTARNTSLMASVEIIGAFGEEDYDPSVAAGLKFPLPFLGIHNAPYPRSPWARTATPPMSPVTIYGDTYVGNGTGHDLTFRTPVHWLWIRRVNSAAGRPEATRWWSSRLAAGFGPRQGLLSSLMPDQLLNAAFSTASTATAPTGVGAMPDRASEVAAIANAHLDLLDGNEDHRRDLAGIIARELNLTIPADGNNWGLLQKNDRTPPFIPADILVWKPTGEHVDILTDDGPMWGVHGPISAAWAWIGAGSEGQQEQSTTVRISGSDVESNENGATYAYLAIGDPGMRFMLNGATKHAGAALPTVHTLIHATFLALFGWFVDERPGVTGTAAMFIKGPGNAAAALTKLTGAQVTPAVTVAAGALTMDTAAAAVGTDLSHAFSLFRMDDGSSDPGRWNVVRILSYTGNGVAGTRSIALPHATGKRPLWAAIVPNGALGYYKDFHHTGGTSNLLSDGTQATTGIVSGGPDELVVGVTLNATGQVYNVFVVMGGEEAGPDGFSPPGVYDPVDPTTPTGGPFGPDPEPPEEPPTEDPPGGGTDPDDPPEGPGDFEASCLAASTTVLGIALGRIGISKSVGIADNSAEALMARLVWNHAVDTTLRDFPWPFATRYAHLTLVSGSLALPVNRDWTYSYRRPIDCVFERRIAVDRSGAVDPTPPPFALSSDAGAAVAPLTISAISVANPTVVTIGAHDFVTGAGVVIAGSNSTPSINGTWIVTVIDATHVSIPIAVTVAGTLGTLTRLAPGGGLIYTNEPNAILEYTRRPACPAGLGDALFQDSLAWRVALDLAPALTRIPNLGAALHEQYQASLVKAREVLRPGNPGVRTSVDPDGLDLGAGCAAANVAVVNRALIRIGARTIANLDTEQSREAAGARAIFQAELEACLREFPWSFCTKYEPALTWVAGTATTPANDDWAYSYRYPNDCVFVRRIVTESRREFARAPEHFRVGQDADGNLLFCNRENPTIEYTARIPCVVGRGDALFNDAFAWRLAACLAPSLAQVDPATTEQLGRGPAEQPKERKVTEAQLRARAAQSAWAMYYGVITKAQRADANEAQPTTDRGDADWIRDRG
jgi:hypothetical protein